MRLIDTHAHLDDPRFDADRAQILASLQSGELRRVISAGAGLETSQAAAELAAQHPAVWATAGVHPAEAHQWNPDAAARLEALLKLPRVCAVGEIGLDYYYPDPPHQVQRKAFEAQMALAARRHLPVVIHCRDAYADTLAVLQAFAPQVRGVLHCFSGSWEFAQSCLKIGYTISFAGALTFKNAHKLPEVAARVPGDRLLVETDAPYLSPEPYRGKRNEPARVREVLLRAASLRGENPESLAEQVWANACALFGLPEQ